MLILSISKQLNRQLIQSSSYIIFPLTEQYAVNLGVFGSESVVKTAKLKVKSFLLMMNGYLWFACGQEKDKTKQ